MRKQKFRKTQLSLALTSALAGGILASGPAQAVVLDNIDRLGDAGLFQYYTANGGWQTFFRIINSSDLGLAVKLRFHEAANSREVLDFFVFLSPYDEWSAWTDKDALGDGSGPGIRTNDKSCVYPGPDTNTTSAGWKWLSGPNSDLKGALFSAASFTGIYDDNSSKTSLERLSEGYLEVIGVSSYKPDTTFTYAVTHQVEHEGRPWSCETAANIFKNPTADDNRPHDLPNVLGFNGYLINVAAGQGGGYNPDVLSDFQHIPMNRIALETGYKPNLDSAYPDGFGYGPGWLKVAINQRDATGLAPTAPHYIVDINGDGDKTDNNVPFDADGINGCQPGETFSEQDAPLAAAYTNIQDIGGGCYAAVGGNAVNTQVNIALVPAGTPNAGNIWYPGTSVTQVEADVKHPARIAQRGVWGEAPVRGGVDAVSWEFMRNSVINEWAASPTPGNVVSDYFTQWVLTFPTKNFYVDLQDDKNPGGDDISPTLKDTTSDYAFAPFTEKFASGEEPGTSCDVYNMDVWNREERYKQFTSPEQGYPVDICYETNVVSFNDVYDYNSRGLASNFNVTVPQTLLPTDWDGAVSERGWAQMNFAWDYKGKPINGAVGALTGLLGPNRTRVERLDLVEELEAQRPEWYLYRLGLPVTGFMFSVYNTNDTGNNHAAINEHKYVPVTCLYRNYYDPKVAAGEASFMEGDGEGYSHCTYGRSFPHYRLFDEKD